MATTVKVHMLAFEERPDVIRQVLVPDEQAVTLDIIYYFGQNDFAVGPEKNTTFSLSAGDVIETADGKLHMIQNIGFAEITKEQFESYKAEPRRDRLFSELVRPSHKAL